MHKVFKNKAQRCSTPLKDLGGQKSEIWAQIDFATFHVLKDRGDQK